MLSVLGAADLRVGVQPLGLQCSPLGSQPQRRSAAGVAPRRGHLSTGGRQRLLTRAEVGGSGSKKGGVSGDASSPIPWTQELVNTLLAAVAELGGLYKATPSAVLEAVKWPGLSEEQVADFLQGLQEGARRAAAGAVASQSGNAGGRRERSKHPGNEERSRLHQLVAEGELEELQRLLQQGCDPNSLDSDGMTPLHLAAKAENIDCFQLLVQHGADVEARGPYNCTPLHLAAQFGKGEACKELVALGASLGSWDSQDKTPLVWAAMCDVSGEGVRALVQLGASLNERHPKVGATPLHAAAHNGAVGADRALLNLGADADAADTRGVRPLHAAAMGPAPETLAVAQLLVQAGADVSARDNVGCTPLHYAAMRGKVSFIHFLLSAGADHETRNSNGLTPAQMAALTGKADARAALVAAETQGPSTLEGTRQSMSPVKGNNAPPQLPRSGRLYLEELCTLLQQGLNPDTLVTGGVTTLHDAAHAGAVGHIRMLVHYGATLEYQDKTSGRTPLHLAAMLQQPAACRELVALGANIDARDDLGATPLMLAANRDESGDCVRLLVQAGADLQCMDAEGKRALDYAVMAGWLGPAKVLLEAGAAALGDARSGVSALNLAASLEGPYAVGMVRLLLTAGLPVSAADDRGVTALHMAAVAGNAEVARMLLQAGAHPNALDWEGRTPVQLASVYDNPEVELLLRQAG